MTTGDDTRPDGRTSTPETRKLRAATRAFRLHLDELPIDYDELVPPDHFLSGLAFMFARNRYGCAESLIGSGFGGTVIGAIARSLLLDGLRWLWIAQDSGRRACVLGDLLEERGRLASSLDSDACETLTRFLMPIPPVADLTCSSRTWLNAPSLPSEDALLDELFAARKATRDASVRNDGVGELSQLLQQAHQMLDLAGLRGAAMVLAQAGHGNYLGQKSTLTDDGTPGFDLRADHEALFMHTAAVGTFAVLVGTAVATPDSWPHDVNRVAFLTAAEQLASDVAAAAMPIHRLTAVTKAGGRTPKSPVAQAPFILHGAVVIDNETVGGELLDIDLRLADLVTKFENFVGLVKAAPVVTTPPPEGLPLHVFLTHGSALSNLQTVFTTFDQPGGGIMTVFAARALLEEAARLHWRYSVQGEEAKARAKQYFDEYRYRQRRTIRTLAGHGIPKKDALRLFDLPPNVLTPPGIDQIAKNRTPIPTVAQMLRSFGAGSAQPNWLEVTYSLMSQITHATPLGYLHCLRYKDGEWIPNELSVEMFSLALDSTAIGSAHLIGVMGLLYDDISAVSRDQLRALKTAAAEVHAAARQVHGLDLLSPRGLNR